MFVVSLLCVLDVEINDFKNYVRLLVIHASLLTVGEVSE
jgi:hypothetical protein